ncbi:putative Zn-dependent peptidase [Propionibacteriaceae bacterium ES.041]|nr:putative Zn-dependent peptidase [Propionibacteriaceae bacterium ES.041]
MAGMEEPTAGAYPLHERTLDNGLRVIVSPDHHAPAVAVNLWYDVGSRHEQPGRTGFAHLFEHLMFQGSANVAAGQHIALLQAAGASVNATTWFDRTNYFEALPTGGLELALWLEADRLASLPVAVGQQNLDNQREVVKEEKRQRYDNVPYGDVMERLVELTFPADHPYGHTTIGSMADLDAATLDDVHAFFRTFYLPNNAVLTLVGDVEPEQGFALADRYFGQIPAGPAAPRPVATPLPAIDGLPRAEVSAAVPADAAYFSWRLPALGTREQDAVDLALSVLGGSQTSRLHRELVRRSEVATDASASALPLIGGTSFGFASVRCREGTSPERAEQALVAELTRLAEDGPSEEELQRARAQFERAWLQSLSRLETRADQISGSATLLDDPGRVNTRVGEVLSIGADEVRRAARTHLDPEHRATLIYRRSEESR